MTLNMLFLVQKAMRVGSFMYFVMLYKIKRTNKMGGFSAGLKKVLGVPTNIFSSFTYMWQFSNI